jgi:surface carbohydrate biosynthesis protein
MKSVKRKKLAYCFLISNESRDFHILLPVIYYLERFKDFEVHFIFVWQAHVIYQNPPELVILPNTRGNNMYYEIADYAFKNGITIYHHDSEGNFDTSGNFDWWGYNLKKKFYCPVQFAWNERVKTYVENKYGFPEDTVKVSGGVGFDRYKYLPEIDRQSILSQFGKEKYRKIVGYAGWAFGKIYNKEFSEFRMAEEWGEKAAKEWMIDQRDFVREVLQYAIEKHPDTLFILKKHPRENFESDNRDSPNEMNVLLEYPNVLYLKNEVPIHELIQITDVWVSYESTSAMEAWLIGTPTICIKNEKSLEFHWSDVHEGCLLASDQHSFSQFLTQIIDEQQKEADLLTSNKKNRRKEILTNAIGFSDGLNHIRAMKWFAPYLDEPKSRKRPAINLKFLRLAVLLLIGKSLYPVFPSLFRQIPVLNKHIWLFKEYKLEEVKVEKKRYYPCLDRFYDHLHIKTEIDALDLVGANEA